jgi:hypothetical protein
MNKEKVTEFVISELGKHHSRNEIITTLCEKGRLHWSEAEKLVQEIEAEHGHTITARQSPIIIVLGVGLLIIGIGLTIYNAIFFINFFQTQHEVISVNSVFDARAIYYRSGALIAGILMIIGGLSGSWKTISDLLNV